MPGFFLKFFRSAFIVKAYVLPVTIRKLNEHVKLGDRLVAFHPSSHPSLTYSYNTTIQHIYTHSLHLLLFTNTHCPAMGLAGEVQMCQNLGSIRNKAGSKCQKCEKKLHSTQKHIHMHAHSIFVPYKPMVY